MHAIPCRITAALLGLLLALCLAPAVGAEIYPDAESVRPLLPGMEAPPFTVQTVHGESVHVDPGARDRPVVLTFYRGGWCPYCNMHLAELRHAEDELQALGFDVWFLSADRPELLRDSLKVEDIDYQLYSDAGLEAAQKFGIAFRLEAQTLRRYADHGLDLSEVSGHQHGALPAPATFIIGTEGTVQFQYTNPDYRVRLAPEVLLAAARAYLDDAHRRLQRGR